MHSYALISVAEERSIPVTLHPYQIIGGLPSVPMSPASPAAVFRQFWENCTAKHHFLKDQNCRKSAKPSILISPNLCLPYSAPIPIKVLHHQLLHGRVSSSCSVLISSVSPGIPPLMMGLHSPCMLYALYSFFALNDERTRARKFSKRMSRQSTEVVQTLNSTTWSVTKSFKHC